LIMDEIDQIKSIDVLCKVYSWPNIPHTKVILIGIANELTLTEKLPKLNSSLNKITPKVIRFDAYTKNQIISIINSRLKPRYHFLFDPKAIEYIAAKSTISGDIRKALDVCIKSLDVAHAKFVSEGNNLEYIQVKLSDVVPIVRSTLVSREITSIKELPFHQKLILCCMVKLAKDREVGLHKLLEKYRQVAQNEGLPFVSTPEFLSMCDLVATTELVTIKEVGKKNYDPRTCLSVNSTKSCKNMKAEIHVSADVVSFAVSEEPLLSKIMETEN